MKWMIAWDRDKKETCLIAVKRLPCVLYSVVCVKVGLYLRESYELHPIYLNG